MALAPAFLRWTFVLQDMSSSGPSKVLNLVLSPIPSLSPAGYTRREEVMHVVEITRLMSAKAAGYVSCSRAFLAKRGINLEVTKRCGLTQANEARTADMSYI